MYVHDAMLHVSCQCPRPVSRESAELSIGWKRVGLARGVGDAGIKTSLGTSGQGVIY